MFDDVFELVLLELFDELLLELFELELLELFELVFEDVLADVLLELFELVLVDWTFTIGSDCTASTDCLTGATIASAPPATAVRAPANRPAAMCDFFIEMLPSGLDFAASLAGPNFTRWSVGGLRFVPDRRVRVGTCNVMRPR